MRSCQAEPAGAANGTTVLFSLNRTSGALKWSLPVATNVTGTYSSVSLTQVADRGALVFGAGNQVLLAV